MDKKVSIIIPVYNGSNYLREAIDSALAQTYKNIEILVVNDGSKDDGATEAIALSYGEQIRYFKKENGGVASALNMGIRNMEGEYFSWLSHDDVYYSDKVEKEIEAIKASGDETTLVQCEYDFYDMGTGAKTASNYHEYYSQEQLENSVFTVLQVQIHACGALIHKSHFDRVGLFNENIRTVQDVEMWFRLYRNQKVLFIPECLYFVREHAEAGNRTEKNYYAETCKLYLDLIRQMSDEELEQVYGSAFRGVVRIAAFLRSFENASSELEERLQTCVCSSIDISSIEAVSELLKSKQNKVYIFGAGMYGVRIAYEMKKRGLRIDGFLDNNPKLEGKEIEGFECYMPSILENVSEEITVLIAARNYSGIEKQLTQFDNLHVVKKLDVEALLYKNESVGR